MAKNRFKKEKRSITGLRGVVLPIVSFSALFLLFLSGLSSISKTTQAQQQASLAAAIRRSAVHCYATEGTYPASLSYLKEHYGIRYDEKKYLVDYEVFASNLMPEITVIART